MIRSILQALLKLPPAPERPFGSEEKTRVFHASLHYLDYRLFGWRIGAVIALGGGVMGFLVAVVAALAASATGGIVVLLVGLPLLVLLIVFLAVLWAAIHIDYEYRWYMLTDRSLRIREGVFIVREMTMTFANIQNLRISQGPLQRWFGISDLIVRTAGGGETEGSGNAQEAMIFNYHKGNFRGLDNADEIRTLMMERLRRLRDAGLGDTDDPGADDEATRPEDWMYVLEGIRDEAARLRENAVAIGRQSA